MHRTIQGPFQDQPQGTAPRRAFTLTEMLVVITIIAVLASLVSVAVVKALGTAKQTRIKVETDALDMAMKAYKLKYESFPPCDLRTGSATALAALRQHIGKAFPRYNQSNLIPDLTTAGVDTTNFRPDQSLVFWLRGFGPDQANPFVTMGDLPIVGGSVPAGSTAVTRTPFFDFDQTRLALVASSATNLIPSYFPQGVKIDTTGAPYLYWDAFNYPVAPAAGPPTTPLTFVFNSGASPFSNAGIATPYWADLNNNSLIDLAPEGWVNPTSFQIISSGMDGKYGSAVAAIGTLPRLYPTGTNYDPPQPNGDLVDDDNVTNFCAKARLSDAKP